MPRAHTPHPRRPRSKPHAHAFTLISVLFLVAIATLLAVGLLTLTRLGTSRASADRDLAEARANAQFALHTALSQLQLYAGPDQAASASAALLDPASPNPHWTAVWHTSDEARSSSSLPAFLVSGNHTTPISPSTTSYQPGYFDAANALPEPAASTPATSITLVDRSAAPPGSPADHQGRVTVPLVPLSHPTTGQPAGHFAYWVGDEGIKARVNLPDPHRANPDPVARARSFLVAQRSGSELAIPGLDPHDPRLPSTAKLSEVALLTGQIDLAASHFHDLTTCSVGLLTDARHGGLRRDLTMAFESTPIFEREFNVRSTGIRNPMPGGDYSDPNGIYQLLDLPTSAPRTTNHPFYLIQDILHTARATDLDWGRWSGGPNWGNLREFYLLHQRTDFPNLPHPLNATKMRHYSWNPYKHGKRDNPSDDARGKKDFYHRNSPVSPVLARAQINLRLRSERVAGTDDYKLILETKPVLALWNPYNVYMSPRRYRFDWEISTYITLRVGTQTLRYDLYRLWGNPGAGAGNPSPWFSINSATAIDLQPGEIRLLTVDTPRRLSQNINLVTRWDDDGTYFVTLPATPPTSPGQALGPDLIVPGDQDIEIVSAGLVAATENENWSNALAELQKHNTFMAIKYDDSSSGLNSAVNASSARHNNLWQANDKVGPRTIADGEIPPFRPSNHTNEPAAIAAWSYYLRTTREDSLGMRNFIDANVRAIVGNSRWDGSVEGRGWRALAWLADNPDRALLPPGLEEPDADGLARYRGFAGNALDVSGQTHIAIFDVPRQPPLSLGHLQHANIGRYNNEPSFIIANSYQNPRIPLGQTLIRNFGRHDAKGLYSDAGLDVYDLSYLVNERLFDSYFFSSLDQLAKLPQAAAASQLDAYLGRADTAPEPLPNSRYRLVDPTGSLSLDDLTSADDPWRYRAIAAHLLVDGAFNVNSTSVAAWRATLASLSDIQVPIHNPTTGQLDRWEDGTIIFSHLSAPLDDAFDGSSSTSDRYWRGYRELTAPQLDALAEAIVHQVRLRGPFRSLADFVNRSLVNHAGPATDETAQDTRTAGALQMALDAAGAPNAEIPSALSFETHPIPDDRSRGWRFYDVPGAQQGIGLPGHILQGAVLQALAPILTTRSDTFRIRAYGDATRTSRSGQPTTAARAYLEAIVQRLPDPVAPIPGITDPSRHLVQDPADIATYPAPYLGRRFQIVAFRWLDERDL
jgi:type II secretory pathway pseudopilin PulG